jgi:tetratricopeptide (TPR) repeat protein
MNAKALTISVVAVVISFVGGFVLANALNRSELDELRAENSRLKTASASAEEPKLTDEEIRATLAKADQNPENFALQKNVGMALYSYAASNQETKYLNEVVKLLQRAASLNPQDFETQVTLGNLHLDLAQINKDNESYKKAREFYAAALKIKPDNADAQNDFGLTFYLENPPEYDRAVAEFQKALRMKPDHEKALENLTKTYLKQGKAKEAAESLDKLKKANPANKLINEFEAQLVQGKNNQ